MTYREFLNAIENTDMSPSAIVSNYHIAAFLKRLEDTHAANIIDLERGTTLWRSQLGCNWCQDYQDEFDEEIPFHRERMLPNAEYCNAGRANAKGVAYLYVASDAQTAMSEMRPWIGSYVSLAQLNTTKKLKIIDCTLSKTRPRKKLSISTNLEKGMDVKEFSSEEERDLLWYNINKAFSKPVGHESKHEYLPTQIIAEFFKSLGFDGIKYKSSLTEKGHNYVLFNLESATIVNIKLYKVDALNYQFDRVDNRCTQQIY